MMALWVALAGSAGAVARFVLDGMIRSRRATEFPWGTMVINVTGSLLLGFVVGLVLFRGAPSEVQTIIGVGFCGGYTTFSTASVETIRLIQRRRYLAGVTNALATLVVTVAAGAVGLGLAGL